MKRLRIVFLVLLYLMVPAHVFAQEPSLDLKLTRDWGYGGFDGRIQGTFSLRASGPQDLVEVQFLIDNEIVYTDVEPPFQFQFKTDRFAPGSHSLTAFGILSDGTQIPASTYHRFFLSNEEARQETMRLVVPILVGVGGLTLIGVLSPLVLGRKRKHKPGQYGIAGGAVCPRCELPFARSLFAPNLIAGKLSRCPHCGKLSVVPRASQSDLQAAEKRLAQEGKAEEIVARSEEEQFEKLLEDSRFDN